MGNERIAPKSTQKHQMLKNLGFSEPFDVNGRSSIADIFPADKRCGIYILHFANGEHYVGQSIDVSKRYQQHRQTFTDISSLSFKTVQHKKINQVERKTIETLESANFLLRNITFTSITWGETDFDEVMSTEAQENWLNDLIFVDSKGPRPEIEDLYRRTERTYLRFVKHPHAKQISHFLRAYIPLAIPAYRRTEANYWSMTSPKNLFPVRINLHWQEVFAVRFIGGQSYAIFQIAKSPLDRRPRIERIRLRYRHRSAWRFSHRYRPGGQDQVRFEVPLDKALRFIQEPEVTTAIRLLNLRLMRKGMTNYRRNHCVHLVDDLIGESSSAK